MAKTRKDVEFAVDDDYFASFNEAAGHAIARALSGKAAEIDVLVHSEAGARWFGGDDAVAEYREDPEASIFKRITIRADDKGRIP